MLRLACAWVKGSLSEVKRSRAPINGLGHRLSVRLPPLWLLSCDTSVMPDPQLSSQTASGASAPRFHCTVSLNTVLALSSKIFFRSSGLSHSMLSIIGLMLSMERFVAGSTEDPIPGHSVPNRQ